TTFEKAFNSEFKEHIQKYTRFDAQSFRDAMIKDMDFIMKYMLETILHQQEIHQLLNEKKLQTQEVQSNTVQELKVDPIVMENTCSGKENSNSQTALGKKTAFMSLFGQDADFTSIMLLNVDQLQKQLDKDEFQKDGSLAAFWVVNKQFQKFIDLQFSLNYDSQMTNKYFAEYIGIEVNQFTDTLLQHMSNVKKSVAERTCHQRQYDRRVNKGQMQTQESKVDTGKALDVDLVVTENIRPIYDEEPMAEVQLTAECNVFATGQQHTEQPEIITEGQHGQILNETSNKAKIKRDIDEIETINIELEHSVAKLLTRNEHLNKESETLKKHYKDLYDSIKLTRAKTIKQTTSLIAQNANLKDQIQEKVFTIAALKNELRKSNGNSVDTKFAKNTNLGETGFTTTQKLISC
ncbi:hypothetical protein Tco_1188400, partial [Tanacetum coccineum]